jgi:hypothetical protein
MQASYCPPEGRAVCPHCATATPVLLLAFDALVFAALRLRCLGCGQSWNEIRDGDAPDTATRFWTPAAAAATLPAKEEPT